MSYLLDMYVHKFQLFLPVCKNVRVSVSRCKSDCCLYVNQKESGERHTAHPSGLKSIEHKTMAC